MGEAELWIAGDELAFELELDDGDGLLHPRHLQRLAQPHALAGKLCRRVVAIHIARQFLQRRERDAVAFLKLRETSVAQGKAQHRGDARIAPEARAEPRGIVVAPGDRHVRLVHDDVNDAVDARTAVAEIASDDELRDEQIANDARREPQEIQLPPVLQDRLQQRIEIRGAALEIHAVEQLAERRTKAGREDGLHRRHVVPPREHAQDFKLQPAHPPHEDSPRRRIREALLHERLARVVDEVEQLQLLRIAQALAERLVHQRTKAARGVVDDVLELHVFAMHVADDMDGALWQSERGAQPGDGRERSLRRGELIAKRAEKDECLCVELGHEG